MTFVMYGPISSWIDARNASSSLTVALGHELDPAVGEVADESRNLETRGPATGT